MVPQTDTCNLKAPSRRLQEWQSTILAVAASPRSPTTTRRGMACEHMASDRIVISWHLEELFGVWQLLVSGEQRG